MDTLIRTTDWIQTFTGRMFYPLEPHPDDVDIIDIAHALSLTCRFTGHCRQFYSVAQHSVHVAELVTELGHPELALTALLHDASEAYLADVARPVKKSLPEIKAAEYVLDAIIAERFGLVHPFPEVIKKADNILLLTEARDLMNTPPVTWKDYGESPLHWEIYPLQPADAEDEFLALFDAIRSGGD